MAAGDLTPDDLLAGAGSTSSDSGTLDLYGLGDVGNGPVYYTSAPTRSIGEHSGGGQTFSHILPTSGTSYAAQFAASSQSSPADYQGLQAALYAAGFYTDKPRVGVYTSADAAALKKALTAYQQVNGATGNMTFDEYLQKQAAGVKATGGVGAGSTRAPLQVQLTDPTSIKATLQSAAQSALGRDLNEKELDTFVSKFQGQETSAQTNAYNGATTVTPPDLSGQSAQYLISQHGPEHDQKMAAGFLDSLANKLGVLT